jgi:hypothetical protein
MKSLYVAAAALAVAGSLSAATSASAAEDHRPCVSQQEFAKAKKGMAMKTVHSLFDTAGKRASIASSYGYTIEVRTYQACTAYGSVAVSYENGKLSAKSGVF